ncbi:MAG: hypothetical protein QM784_23450 [Polyangiaceae bacterium]
MHTILQGLRDLEGVHGTFVSDSAGQLLSYNAESIYDASLLQQVSKAVANAIDSVKLLEEDWETITAQFSEGRLLIRSIPPSGRSKGPPLTLSLVADTRLNPSFATVAIRVAIGKIKTLLESNGGTLPTTALTSSMALPAQMPPPATAAVPMAASHPMTGSHMAMGAPNAGIPAQTFSSVSTPEVAGSGLSWSGLGTSSQMSASGVAVADAASSTALSACTKCLAKAVGPMAKVFVKEAVRKITPNQPFAKAMLPALIAELEKGIEDSDDAKEFRKAAMKLV